MNLSKKFRQHLTLEEAEQLLQELWKTFNKEKFQGKLKKTKVKLMNKPLVLGVYQINLIKKKIVTSQIMISETLFYRGSQKTLVDTLLHEMSHQYCSEVLGLINEQHGKQWRKICKMCGAIPRARSHERPQIKVNINQAVYWNNLKSASSTIPNRMKVVRWLHPRTHRWLEGLCLKKIKDEHWIFLWIHPNKKTVKWFVVHPETLFATSLTPKAQREIRKNFELISLNLDF